MQRVRTSNDGGIATAPLSEAELKPKRARRVDIDPTDPVITELVPIANKEPERPKVERWAPDKVQRIIEGIRAEGKAWDAGERPDTPSWQARLKRET